MENKKKPVDRRYSETYAENHGNFEADETSTDQPKIIEVLSKKNKKLNCAIGLLVALLSFSIGVNVFFLSTNASSEDAVIKESVIATTDNDVGCVPVVGVLETGHPLAFVISSSGGAQDHWPTFMGMYKLTSVIFTSKPVYKHETENEYLYFNSENLWALSEELHFSYDSLYAPNSSNSDLPPRTGWKFNDAMPKVDNSLTVQQIKGSAYNISSSGGAIDEYPQAMGVYTLTKDDYNNKPVYKKETTDSYLFVNSNDDWVVHDELHENHAWMYASLSTNSDNPPTSGWKYFPNGWSSDPSLTVTQVQI